MKRGKRENKEEMKWKERKGKPGKINEMKREEIGHKERRKKSGKKRNEKREKEIRKIN